MTKARVNADNASADIQGVTAGTGLTGGGTSGTVTLTNDMATAIDAKGDLVVGTGADTYDNLAVGNNGETLVPDSSASVGLRYQEPKAGNPVLNSSFQIWQRGTSTTDTNNAGRFIADRWQIYSGTSGRTYSRQLTNDTTNLPNIQYCMRVARNSGNTATNQLNMGQNLETANSIPFAGKSVVLSFYARAGANYSATSNALGIRVVTGTGTDQNGFYDGYTGQAIPIDTTVTLTTTWQRFSVTGAIGATTTELLISFLFSPTGTAGANDYYEITGVQFEVGSVATPFKTYAATLAGELAACQRYYYRNAGGKEYSHIGFGMAFSTTQVAVEQKLPVTMRVVPTSIEYSNVAVNLPGAGNTAITSLAIVSAESSPDIVQMTAVVASGLTQYRPYYLLNNNNTAGYVGYNAEL